MNVNLYEAKTQLSSLVERAARGEEIVIAKNGTPMARLVALPRTPRHKRKLGQLEGLVVLDGLDLPIDPELFEGNADDPLRAR